MMYKKYFLVLVGWQFFWAQDPAPPATYAFEEDEAYIKKKASLLRLIEQNSRLEIIDSLTQWASLHKDWETVLDYAPQALTLSPTAQRYYRWGGAAGFRSLEVPRILALPYVDKMKQGFIKAHQLAPNDVFILRALIETYTVLPSLLGGDIDLALEKAEVLSAKNPLEGFMAKGYIAENTNQPLEAKKHYQKAFALLSKLQSTGAWYWEANRRELPYELGSVSARFQMEMEAGKALLQHYLQIYNQKDTVPLAWVYYHLGALAQMQRKPQEALVYYKKAQQRNPKLDGLTARIKEVSP
ncbi:MAG: tetratricopeptide repeat protein [Flavobacteriaceae bacterium]